MSNKSAIAIHAQHADAPEGRVEDVVRAGQRAGVRGRRLGRLRRCGLA